jgi:hypothetical protein
MVMNSVEDWIKRTKKKGPFKLCNVERTGKGKKYTVIFKDKGKVKIGVLRDGMWCRYGINTFGALSHPNPTGLWQTTVGSVSEEQLLQMIDFWIGNSSLKDFNLESLNDLKW